MVKRSETVTGANTSSPSSSQEDGGLTAQYSQLSKKASRSATFEGMEGARLGRALDRVIEHGDAVVIGRTSDGGSIAFTFLSGKARYKAYAASSEELDEILDAILEA